MAGNRVQRGGTAYTAKDAAKRHKRPCRSAPATPAFTVAFRRMQAKGKRRDWKAIANYTPVTLDVAGRPITVEQYQAQLRYTDASGVPINLDTDYTPKSCTAVASTDLFTCTGHGLQADDQVSFSGLTGGAGLTAGQVYFVIASGLTSNAFKVSATQGGASINMTTDLTAGTVRQVFADDVLTENVPGDHSPSRIVFPELNRPKTWYVQIRMRVLNRVHGGRCWSAWSAWSTATKPASGAIAGPDAPASVNLVLDRVEGTYRYPWRARVGWNEMTTWSPPDDDGVVEVGSYQVQLAVSHNGGTTTINTRNMTITADQSLSTNKAEFFNIRGKFHYRARVRSIDADGNVGAYSAWTSWLTAGGAPNPVTGLTWSNPNPGLLVAKWNKPANMQNVDKYRVRTYRQPGLVLVDEDFVDATRYRYEIPKADRDNAHRVKVVAIEPVAFEDVDLGATAQNTPDQSTDVDSSDVSKSWSIETSVTGTRMELTPEGLRTIEATVEDDLVTAELLPDGSSFGIVGIGEVVSDNVVTFNRDTIQRFIDPVYGDDANDGLMPKPVIDTFNRVSSSGWGGSMSDGKTEKTLQTSAAADDIIDCTGHGFQVDDAIMFTSLTGGAGLVTGVIGYVIAANFGANTFQVSLTKGGSAINFTTDITAGTVIKAGYHRWTVWEGTASKFTTDRTGSGRARMALAASDTLGIWARAGGMFDEVVFKTQWDKVPTTALARCGPMFRLHDIGGGSLNGYQVRFSVAAAGGVPTLDAVRFDGATATVLGTPVSLPDAQNFAANTDWTIRAQVFYDYVAGVTTIRAKAWKSSGSEPSTWTFVDTTQDGSTALDQSGYQRGGSIGIRGITGAIGNPNLTMSFSAFEHKLLDPDALAADSTDATVGAYDFAPTSTGPYQTLERALRDIPRYNQAAAFLNYHNGYDVDQQALQDSDEPRTYIEGFVGGGEMFITGAGGSIIGGIIINGCSHWIQLNGLLFSDSGGGSPIESDATVRVNASRHVEVMNCRIQSNGLVTRCVNFTQSSGGIVRLTQLNGASRAVTCGEASVIQCYDNRGAGTTNGYQANSGIIMSQGSAPTGGSSASNSGKIFASTTADAPASTDGGTAGGTTTKRTKSWKSVAASTYGITFDTWSPGDATQGAYGGGQNHKGMWKLPDAVQSTLSGKTIDSGTITVRRVAGGGASSPQNIYLFTANTSAFTSNPGVTSGPVLLGSLGWGDTKTFRVPKSLLDDLKTAVSGNTRLIGLYQSGGSPYVICAAPVTLKVTYH